MQLAEKNIGFIGPGAMAEALITGILKSGLIKAENIYAGGPNVQRLNYLQQELKINTSSNNLEVANAADIIFLAVKPYLIKDVLEEIKDAVNQDKLIISIAAGITIQQMEAVIQSNVPVIRTVPNTPALVGEGATAISKGTHATEQDEQMAVKLFETAGKVVVLPENLLNGVTGLSGSGPAYVYLMIEALADAGVMSGLPRDISYTLAAQTLVGGGKMLLETNLHPGELKDKVTTPNGTTIAALHQLEKGNLRATLQKAVAAAVKRAEELSTE